MTSSNDLPPREQAQWVYGAADRLPAKSAERRALYAEAAALQRKADEQERKRVASARRRTGQRRLPMKGD